MMAISFYLFFKIYRVILSWKLTMMLEHKKAAPSGDRPKKAQRTAFLEGETLLLMFAIDKLFKEHIIVNIGQSPIEQGLFTDQVVY